MDKVVNSKSIVSVQQEQFVPKDRLEGLKQNWKSDLVSGFILSLIALPLSLAIAMASGAPPMAGLFSAIIAGIVVSQLTDSHVSINGPAAGLIVVMAGSVERLGGGAEGYHAALAAVVIAGIVLTVLGVFRAGVLGLMMPSIVVHGMLAAIGFIIIAKEIPIFLGFMGAPKEPLSIYARIPDMIMNMNPEVALIGFVGLLILIAYSYLNKFPLFKKIPAPIIVVLVGILMGEMFDLEHAHSYLLGGHHYALDPKRFLVILPPSMLDAITMPDWSKIGTQGFWYSTIVIILVQGIESVLSCSAVEKLDPYKRKVDLSKDLLAVGAATGITGMIGGIPSITEIVRSTANVTNGARTRWSNFFHGVFILLFVLLGAAVIDLIPQAALAALLIMVGYRLASPKEFKHAFEKGWDQLFLYCVTIISVLATDLMVGVLIGVACKFVLHLINGAPIGPNLFVADTVLEQEKDNKEELTLKVNKAAIFSNFLSLKKQLDKIPLDKHLRIDLSNTCLVDHSTLEHLDQFKREYSKGGGHVEIGGLAQHKSASKHALSCKKLSKR